MFGPGEKGCGVHQTLGDLINRMPHFDSVLVPPKKGKGGIANDGPQQKGKTSTFHPKAVMLSFSSQHHVHHMQL